jgi:transcriptional repressor NrdR
MKCPKCHEIEDKVIDSRLVKDGEVIRRRRVCRGCGFRFTTYEEVVRSGLRVLKRSGITEEFKPAKILQGIQKSCEKRPVTEDQINQAVDTIVKELEAEYEKEVPSMAIGRKIMTHLEHMDEVAYVRFASVYRRYRDVNQFLSEVESLIGRE